ncbi:MAG: hypothetical protein JJ939_15295 [Alphaproteobacteria bacterium]|nr:hypothetical protein [Alphaproteobacteria bacterium]MBO6629781.1 hypothetical protein [Alphaproteobacteria bacterium]MDF1625035.1 YciI family protein [Parvibaculaceae bacterium]
MFVVTLKFDRNKDQAAQHMAAHNAWIQSGFDDGVFLLVGGLQPKTGGAVIAFNTSREDLERRVQEDPFVKEGIVHADIIEISPARLDDRLSFIRSDT